jgi:hypothetical protein
MDSHTRLEIQISTAQQSEISYAIDRFCEFPG